MKPLRIAILLTPLSLNREHLGEGQLLVDVNGPMSLNWGFAMVGLNHVFSHAGKNIGHLVLFRTDQGALVAHIAGIGDDRLDIPLAEEAAKKLPRAASEVIEHEALDHTLFAFTM